MGTRIVRDGLLESEAVLSLPPEGRWLYVSILLSADDYGLFEATPFKLAKRADVKREHVQILLQSMHDVDLVRLYRGGDALSRREYGVVTKFSQRLRGYKAKHPLPPRTLVGDQGEDYLREFNKLASEKADRGTPPSDRRRPDTETETETDEARSSTLASKPDPSTSSTGLVDSAVAKTTRKRTVAPCPTEELVALWHELCAPPLATVGVFNDARRTAISTRWREVCASSGFDKAQGLEWFRWLFAERVAGSDFLMGRFPPRHGKSWRCNWDWVMSPTNFAKVVDGNYVNRKGAT